MHVPEGAKDIQKDIQNNKGVLLAPAGTNITDDIYQKILRHKLLEPLDEYLGFGSQVSVPTILESITDIGKESFDSNGLDFSDAIKRIEQFIDQIQLDHISLNKLTVLKADNPRRYSHSLTTALMSTEIGIHLKYSRQQLAELFMACLFHDIGELHLDNKIYDKKSLTDEDAKSIRVHPIVGYLILSGSKTKFSKRVLQAVLTHHERLDGSGYPLKLKGPKINQYAVILGVIDTFQAIRLKGGSIHDALSVLKFSSSEKSTGKFAGPALSQEIVSIVEERVSNATDDGDKDLPDDLDSLVDALSTFEDISDALKKALINLEGIVTGQNPNLAGLPMIKNLYNNILWAKKYWIDSSGIDHFAANQLLASSDTIHDIRQVVFQVAPRISNSIAEISAQVKQQLDNFPNKNNSELIYNTLFDLDLVLNHTRESTIRIQQHFYPSDFNLN